MIQDDPTQEDAEFLSKVPQKAKKIGNAIHRGLTEETDGANIVTDTGKRDFSVTWNSTYLFVKVPVCGNVQSFKRENLNDALDKIEGESHINLDFENNEIVIAFEREDHIVIGNKPDHDYSEDYECPNCGNQLKVFFKCHECDESGKLGEAYVGDEDADKG